MTGFEIYFAIASAVATGYSSYQQNKQAEQQSKAEAEWHAYNAKVAEQNAAAERENAEAERRAVEQEAQQHRREGKILKAKQRARIGASGVQMVGSPLLVAVDTARQLALENANLREAGYRRVAEYGRRAQAYRSQSILDISKSSASKSKASGYGRAALIGAGSSIMQGASSVAYARSQGASYTPWKKTRTQPNLAIEY